MTAVWWVEIPISLFVAVYGGAWLAELLAGHAYVYHGAAFGLANLVAAIITVLKEKPSLKERVRSASRLRSPYSSVLVLSVVFLLMETFAFIAAAGALAALRRV